MDRITPEQIIEAFEATKLKPVQRSFGTEHDNKLACACGLTAFSIHKDAVKLTEDDQFDNEALAEEVAGYIDEMFSFNYRDGFISGFDKVAIPEAFKEDLNRFLENPELQKDPDAFGDEEVYYFAAGYQDGKAAWEAIQARPDLLQ